MTEKNTAVNNNEALDPATGHEGSDAGKIISIMSAFLEYTAKHLPDDILKKLEELRSGTQRELPFDGRDL